MAAPDPPSLALSDIIRFTTSPSPHPVTDIPAPVDPVDPPAVRARLADMGLAGGSKSANTLSAPTPREQELADMILRLTSTAVPDTSQLMLQAETIAGLLAQRSILVEQAEEQRARWNAEREGWERMAEALIAQRVKGATVKDELTDADRQVNAYEADNKALRQKLADAQNRLRTLEAELARLRPLLLMQPLEPLPMPIPAPSPTKPRRPRRGKGKEKEKPLPPAPAPVKGKDSEEEADELEADDEALPDDRRKGKRRRGVALLSDARSEHLLLAARKIGRERAGLMQVREREREKEKKRREEEGREREREREKEREREREKERERSREREREREKEREQEVQAQAHTPKTPRHGRTSAPAHAGYVYSPVLVPAYHIVHTPRGPQPAAVAGATSGAGPHTPLDSLLSAARSMMDDSPSADTRMRRALEAPESPVPKRRKVSETGSGMGENAGSASSGGATPTASTSASVNGGSMAAGGRERVKSALDVLADQAAAFSSKEQGAASGSGSGSTAKSGSAAGAGKGKSKSKAKDRERDKEKETETRGEQEKVEPSAVPPKEKEAEKEKKGKGKAHEWEREQYPFKRNWAGPPAPRLAPVSVWGPPVDAGSSSPVFGEPMLVDAAEPHPPLSSPLRAPMPLRPHIPSGVSLRTQTSLVPPVRTQTPPPSRAHTPLPLRTQTPQPPGTLTLQLPCAPTAQPPPPRPTWTPQPQMEQQMPPQPIPPPQIPQQPSQPPLAPFVSTLFTVPLQPSVQPSLDLPALAHPPTSTGLITRSQSVDRPSMNGGGNGDDRSSSARRSSSIPPKVGPVSSGDMMAHVRRETVPGYPAIAPRNPDLARVADTTGSASGVSASSAGGKRPRSPYVKWSKEEDELLAQAVAKYGQKWDLVQKALPSRGYHQVRQRWLRKLGVFDSKPDLSSFQTGSVRSGSVEGQVPGGPAASGSGSGGAPVVAAEPPPNPKLGLAPLSSELAFAPFSRGPARNE